MKAHIPCVTQSGMCAGGRLAQAAEASPLSGNRPGPAAGAALLSGVPRTGGLRLQSGGPARLPLRQHQGCQVTGAPSFRGGAACCTGALPTVFTPARVPMWVVGSHAPAVPPARG